MAVQGFIPKERLTSTKMNTLVDGINANTDNVAQLAGQIAALQGLTQQLDKNLDQLIEQFPLFKNVVYGIIRDFGQYDALPDVTLALVETGKRYNEDGKLVADAQWNVGRLGAVVCGNTYELNMGGADKMTLGTALFVAHTQETVGGTTKEVYTPVFSAKSTDIPTSGYVCFEAMEAYDDVLVCYRTDVANANVVKVARYGTKASIATQINNLRSSVDLRAFADAYNQGMRVGVADTLAILSGDAIQYEERLTAGRMLNNAPDLSISNREPDATKGVSSPSIREMRGEVNGGNQMLKDPTMSNRNNFTIYDGSSVLTIEDGVATIEANGGSGWQNGLQSLGCPPPTIDHKKMYYCEMLADRAYNLICSYGGDSSLNSNKANEWTFVSTIATITRENSAMNFYATQGFNASPFVKIKSQLLLDISLLFPTNQTWVNGLGANDAIKVAHRLGFFSYEAPVSDPSNAVQLEDRTLAKMAEVVAKLGYQEPKMWFGSHGRTHLLSAETGKVLQTNDMIANKKKAWKKALEALTEQGVEIPEFATEPLEFSVDGDVAVKWDERGVEVKCWVVDLGRLSWERMQSTFGYDRFQTNLSSKAHGFNNVVCVALSVSKSSEGVSFNDNEIKGSTDSDNLYARCDKYTSAAEFKTAMQGQYLIYPLATPIRIDFDEPVHYDFANANPEVLIGLDDMEGKPMYKVDIETETRDGVQYRKTDIYPNPEWVEAHKQLPVSIVSKIDGIGTAANASLMFNMLRRIIALEAKH